VSLSHDSAASLSFYKRWNEKYLELTDEVEALRNDTQQLQDECFIHTEVFNKIASKVNKASLRSASMLARLRQSEALEQIIENLREKLKESTSEVERLSKVS
jgi:predicted RNase H-like nuclease (RuvC/YqgF family)